MTKVRQSDHTHLKHLPAGSSNLFKSWPPDGRHDSPNSVIPHSDSISQPSSAGASMEHHLYQDPKPQLYQEHGYSTSDDDAFYGGVSLSQGCLKVGTLESLPETHSLALNFSPRNARSGPQETRLKASNSRHHMAESKDFCAQTDSTTAGVETSLVSTGDEFPSVSSQDDTDEASRDLFPASFSRGIQDKKIVTRADLSKIADLVFLEDLALRSVREIKAPGKSGSYELPFFPADFVSEDDCNEFPIEERPISASEGTRKNDLQQMKVTNAHISNMGFPAKLEDGSKKRHASLGLSTGILRTFPSPGTPPRSSFFGMQFNPGSHVNQGSNLEKDAALEVATHKSIRTLPNYFPCQLVKPVFSKALPSKWDDAEKWLVNSCSTDSPSHHPQSRIGSAGALSGFPKQCHGAPAGKRAASISQSLHFSVVGKPAECSISNIEGNGGTSGYSNHLLSTTSDSELLNAQDYRALVRSNSQKYKQLIQGQKLAGVETAGKCDATPKFHLPTNGLSGQKLAGVEAAGKCDATTPKFHLSTNGLSGRKEAPTSEKIVRKIGATTPIGSARIWNDAKDSSGPPRGRIYEEQATSSPAFCKFPTDAMGRFLQAGLQSEIFTQDKYADTVVETMAHGSCEAKEEFAAQASRHKRSASMKDAATEISPTVSRRDMATQITPLGSSRTSRCTTPIKNNSPARHNTPARRSASWSHTGLNLLELESCSLAKLQLRDFPGESQFQSFDKSLFNWSTREEEDEESSTCLRQLDIGDGKKNVMESRALAWEEAERAKCTAKYKREEAKIEAWENHQKAKAEAELKKLEVKLEKLRSQATEKIMNKLSASLKRADEMRAAAQAQQAEQEARAAERAANIRKQGHFPASFGVCFARLS